MHSIYHATAKIKLPLGICWLRTKEMACLVETQFTRKHWLQFFSDTLLLCTLFSSDSTTIKVDFVRIHKLFKTLENAWACSPSSDTTSKNVGGSPCSNFTMGFSPLFVAQSIVCYRIYFSVHMKAVSDNMMSLCMQFFCLKI